MHVEDLDGHGARGRASTWQAARRARGSVGVRAGRSRVRQQQLGFQVDDHQGTGGASTTAAPVSRALGPGVTASTIKIGVVAPDFNCFKQFVDQIRTGERQVWQAYVDAVNDAGGINGRRLVMDFKQFCPVPGTGVQASVMCTQFTEDDKVFAVMGTLVDFSGDAHQCIVGQHRTPLLTFLVDQTWIDKAPAC